MNEVARIPTLAGGAQVVAIVPRTFEETFRVARAVVASKLAPAALIGKLEGDDAASAVAVAIMSGAELGLKPMVALRSFTVINGKPALYGDGLINVVRQSGKVAYLRTGSDERNGKLVGWCEAKRNDTDEDKRVEFSQDDAERAGLWQTEAIVTKWNKFERRNEQKPNDSPWWRFPQRMLAWRAAGYCLRELFGDVLGGIRDEFEAREMVDFDGIRDVTPSAPSTSSLNPPSPPKAPVDGLDTIDAAEKSSSEQGFDLGEFLEELETSLASAKDEAEVEEIWTDYDAAAVLETEGHADMIDAAHAIKMRALAKLSPLNAG
ncbi:MAG: recombinase RecT [Rhodobiaceae bacterium]|nr:recombinase RecT [Rhodobiaceae bacterium]